METFLPCHSNKTQGIFLAFLGRGSFVWEFYPHGGKLRKFHERYVLYNS